MSFKPPPPFSRNCSRTQFKFYHDYDLLPPEFRRILMELPYQPDFDDLEAAVQLAHETGQMKDGVAVKTFSIGPTVKATKAASRRMQKTQAAAERARRRWGKYQPRTIVTAQVRLEERKDKHNRLVTKLTDEEASRLLARRQENKDVTACYEKHITRILKVETRTPTNQPEPEPEYFAKPKPLSITRAYHNAGGKTNNPLADMAALTKKSS